MARPQRLDAALKRLSAALDQCEAAAERLGKVGAERRDMGDTLALMQEDRGRLADDLDRALARTRTLERASDNVMTRLAVAGATLRDLLARADGGTS